MNIPLFAFATMAILAGLAAVMDGTAVWFRALLLVFALIAGLVGGVALGGKAR